jgi:hypothetical protein
MSLILSDGAARRHAERVAYNRAAEALEREGRRRRRFEDDDKPAFERWVEAEFAEELTALREAEQRVSELRILVSDVRRYAELTGVSERRAYELITAARKAGREEALWQDAFGKLSDEERDEAHEEAERADREEARSRQGERPGSDWKEDELGIGRPRGGAVTDYLKGLYRKLVRALHPDVQPDGGKATEKLWHEVQSAYEWADVQTMERIYRSVVKDTEAKVEFSLETCPIGEIIALREDMERRLERLVRETEPLKRHPAWDFAATRKSPRRLAKLAAQVEDDMASDLAQTVRVGDMLAKVVARWERSDERGVRRRRRAGR